jgi:flavin-binding protein dodecin
MNCHLINSETLSAFWAHGLLYLAASGHAECAEYVSISEAPIDIVPPEYQLTSCSCPAIGSFPYNVHAWFHLAEQPETVTIHTSAGAQKVEVTGFPSDLSDDVSTPASLTGKLGEGEVVGVSPNSWDVNRAITNAVDQLRKLYPDNVNAVVTETGVVAAGAPVGIAFLYVRMKQNAPRASKKRSE